MTKNTVALFGRATVLLAMAGAGATAWADASLTSFGGEARAFLGSGRVRGVVELQAREDWPGLTYRALRLGAVADLVRDEDWTLKGGLSYWREYGVLHSWDFDKDPDPAKRWLAPNDRGEDALSVDLTPRLRLSSIWVAALRARLVNHFLRDHRTLKLRPGLMGSFERGGEPFANLFLQVEPYFALEGEQTDPYEVWAYLGSLFAVTPRFWVGPNVAYRTVVWEAGEPGEPPRTRLHAWMLSLAAVLYLDL